MKHGWEIAVKEALRPSADADLFTVLSRRTSFHNAQIAVRWDGVSVVDAIRSAFVGKDREIALQAVQSHKDATVHGWY